MTNQASAPAPQPESRPDIDERRVETRLAEILARYPDRFSEQQIEQIRERVAVTVDVGRTVRRVPLSNGDGF